MGLPITVVARSKTGTVFVSSNAKIVGSNPTQIWADPPPKESYRLCKTIMKRKKSPMPNKGL
jgi:hypothetical protein